MIGDLSATSWQDLIFGAKGEAPELGEPHVNRPRLTALFERATRKRLTTVIAGEGAGKTVGLSTFVRSRPAGAAVWYTSDALDASPVDFLRGLRVAIGAAAASNNEELPLLATVVATIKQRASRTPLLIVVDEVQAAPARALALLLRYLPGEVRVVLAGRAVPDGLDELIDWYRCHNQLASIGAADLALDPTEMDGFARAYQRQGDLAWPGSFALDVPTASYVAERVLPELGPAFVRVAALAAGMEQFDRQQFAALTGVSDGRTLERLAGWTPLVRQRGEQYSWAPGAANALLAALSPEDAQLARLRAGDMLAPISPLRAARCYLSAGAPDRAAAALDFAPSWAWAALPSAAAELLRAVPTATLSDHPALLLARARLAILADAPADVLDLLKHVQPSNPAEQVELLALRGRALLAMDRIETIDSVRQELRFVGERLRGIDTDAAANALAQAGTLAGLVGEPREAAQLLQQAADLLATGVVSAQQRYLLTFATTSLGTALLELGDIRAALPVLDRAVNWAREQGDVARLDEATNNQAMAYASLGQWAKAAGLLQERLDDETAPRLAALRAVLLDSLSDICMANGEDERAIRLCRELLDLVTTADPYARRNRGCAKLGLILARRGLVIEARRALASLAHDGNSAAIPAYLMANGVCLLEEGQATGAVEAIKAAMAAQGTDTITDMVHTKLWLALAYLRAGDASSAAMIANGFRSEDMALLGPYDAQRFADVLALRTSEPLIATTAAPTVVHALRRRRSNGARPRHLEIHLLGAPCLVVDGEPVEFKAWAYRRALEIFCYLVAHRKPIRRDEIAADLLPEIATANARPMLSSALSKMRRTIRQETRFTGDPVTVDDHDRCGLDLAALADHVVVDVDELEGWLRDVRNPGWSGPIAPLLSLTDGEFLEGIEGEWLTPFRRAYADIAELALARALECCEQAGRLQDALMLAQRLSAINPDDDVAAERLRALRRLTGGVSRLDGREARAS